MQLVSVVDASGAVAATRSRLAKAEAIAEVLREAKDEAGIVTAYLSGILPQRRVGISWRGLHDLPAPAQEPMLTVSELDHALTRIAAVHGTGSVRARAELVTEVFSRATAPEQEFVRDLITGNMRQGAQDGVMLAAIAKAADVPEAAVRRAAMLAGFAAPVAAAALTGGVDALARIGLQVGRPVRPMLAASAADAEEAVRSAGADRLIVDGKLDGVRVQVHRQGGDVRVFTRSLDDITERIPEVVTSALELPVSSVVLDGEALLVDGAGRPRPFQDTSSRAMSAAPEGGTQLQPFYFDVLHVDGEDLIDAPARERFARLTALVPEHQLVPRAEVSQASEVAAAMTELVGRGFEGVVVKSPEAPYAAGRRGAGWIKVKPRHTLDLVVLAVEWGSGRRTGWLSNIHLGARDQATGEFVMLGKTFKGMTDEMLTWQTERFLQLETSRSGHVVHVRPEQVVEIAFDGLQRSTRYPGGLALRFARVLRYRDDKTAADADTIEAVRTLSG